MIDIFASRILLHMFFNMGPKWVPNNPKFSKKSPFNPKSNRQADSHSAGMVARASRDLPGSRGLAGGEAGVWQDPVVWTIGYNIGNFQ